MRPFKVAMLDGQSILGWVGTEMALCEDADGAGPVLWTHPGIPYLQLISVDVQLEDGLVYRMLSHFDDGDGHYGLYLIRKDTIEAAPSDENDSIYRTRELNELPIGTAAVEVNEADGPHADLRVNIVIDGHTVSCWAAEVYERNGKHFHIVEREESILIQVDGGRPGQFEQACSDACPNSLP
jgi:hypothetical protein